MTIRARALRITIACAATLLLTTLTSGVAAAIDPPDIDAIPAVTPRDSVPRPPVAMKQEYTCATSATLKDSVWTSPPPANVAFDVDRLHQFATGRGITVAVIDSGVTPNPRLPRLKGGGDYIGNTSGLQDCDHHGTLVAGIIGARKSSKDRFVGVAPDATLISIRQTSSHYSPADTSGKDADTVKSASTLSTLAAAIVHAVNMGAQVLNLSVTACFPASSVVDTSDLAEALRYAVEVKDAVVIASAGNTNDDTCKPNGGYDPTNAADPDNWGNVRTVSMPSYYTPLVLSVGGSTLTGDVYPSTMPGPWVSVSAPATEIVSLDPTSTTGGLTNASIGKDGPQTIAGTSFAAAYVSGLAALIRERDPTLTAAQVRERLVATARTPALTQRAAFGAGNIDALGALTWTDTNPRTDPPQSRRLTSHPTAPDTGWIATTVALTGVAIALLLALLGAGLARIVRARNRHTRPTTRGIRP